MGISGAGLSLQKGALVARPKAIVPVNMERNFIRFMLYGKPDTGKSVLAGTSPKCLILASDQEEPLSAARFGSNADLWVCPDYEAVDEAYEWIRLEGVNEYEWIWIDNGTLLQDQNMDSIMEDLVARKKESGGKTQNRYVPDKPQYLVSQNHLATIIRQFKMLPIHFGMTAHEMVIEWADGTEQMLPQLQGGKGQYSERVCGMFNIVGHMTSRTLKDGTWEGRLRTRHRPAGDNMGILAKDRYAALGRQVINPNVPDMMESIRKVLPTLGKRVKPTATKKSAVPKKAVPIKAAAKKTVAKKATASKKAPAKAVAKKTTAASKKGR